MLKSRVEPRPELLPRELVIGRAGVRSEDQIAVLPDVLIQRDLRRTLAPAPPSLPVTSLIDHDSEDPGPERRLTAEPVERPEDPHEHFLGEVEGFIAIAKQMRGEAQDEMVVLKDELSAGGLIARDTSPNQPSFGGRQFRPAESLR